MSEETIIRIHFRTANGIEDGAHDFTLEDFAGVIPSIGDQILDPGVDRGANRKVASNRAIWTVVGRVFNPKDLSNYVALVVDEREGTLKDTVFI